ncbi:Rpn family recombination-promoting nuclease/putative transposase [Thermosynechococcus sp. CL-1]|uniref:Rpn family recombination-promoting nuclease/putative transposase n=1 Tax=unclassified Thermosynechococcus TaxID=2622553 RepID=UPI00122DDE69|nr:MULTISPECIES: Rpn family recombination-promoting nuclease/putative transposase [unclassified Thermosynechococcus]QEQ01179.1 Rpn family recombination-promoting nuclease/putative transposase [Thermosynechococcus sp. CL-1]WKT82622.1 Rpn family recombination-promoting nuclease/putative transposase [Thermosynechococcus sp. HY596]WNC61748.1 Rpn family recombination-promoting nuclease/putative transposase [Thermosynechococcus sp. HY591]WNC64302.1 Rpn family recombination-promoting nuclease/putative
MRRDSLFYQLFAQLPQTLFDLLGREAPQGYRFESVELKQTAFRIDGVFVPPDPSGTVYFCEVQFQRDNSFYERFFAEIFLYLRLYRHTFSDWQAVVIYPHRQAEQVSFEPYDVLVKSDRLRRVYLNELGSPAELPLSLALMQLMVVPEAEMPRVARLLAQRSQTERAPNLEAIIELITTIVLYKFTKLSREEVLRMLGFTTEELKRTRFYQEVYAEAREEGLQQGEALVVLRLLRRRFGDLPAELEAAIRQLPSTQIETLAEALLDFATLEDLRGWLRNLG